MLILSKFVSSLILLPANLIFLAALGLLLRLRWRRAIWVSWGALALLLVLSTRVGALLLVTPLEQKTPILSHIAPSAQAIVVLGGGPLSQDAQYGLQNIPSYFTLERLRYAARLQRSSKLPILVTGGSPEGYQTSEAYVMAQSLREDFGVPVRWLEEESKTTLENGRLSMPILQQAGITNIVLVTDALHMPRSVAVFQKEGFEVIPAATVYFSHERLTANSFIPSGEGLRRSDYALHEWIGRLWYKIKYNV
jgi:uncharacterized SAM-binding protein YcdF (DUF218 family)